VVSVAAPGRVQPGVSRLIACGSTVIIASMTPFIRAELLHVLIVPAEQCGSNAVPVRGHGRLLLLVGPGAKGVA
jgi:hypothetical protein